MPAQTAVGGDLVYRQRRPVRLWHWFNALAVFVMLMSGMMIFNAHPELYWGQYGANHERPWLEIGNEGDLGFLRVGPVKVPTTGVFGISGGEARAFPALVTIPSGYDLATARQWHFAFAWLLVVPGLLFWLWGFVTRHVQRDLAPTATELAPRNLWHDIKDHARLRFHTGEAARRYNVLQKLSYVGVIFGLLPLMVLTGLTMSPTMDAAWPWMLELFGGRQSARSIHFICASLVAAFIVVHLAMVLLAGPVNELRSIVTAGIACRRSATHDDSLASWADRGRCRRMLLSGCDRIVSNPAVKSVLRGGETLTMGAQRLVTDRAALAPEYSRAEMSPVFRTNGNTMPASDAYQAHVASGFANWRLAIDGLVRSPRPYSLAQLRAMPTRTQITRHDCVEGWSAIGQWTGVPLRLVLGAVGLMPAARYIVFHCADDFDGTPLLREPRPDRRAASADDPRVGHEWADAVGRSRRAAAAARGRQLGYKQVKYVMRIEAVADLASIGQGGGGYWEDSAAYQWYAGI